MGRGRAKAKQTKVARELKYNSGGFDANRLSHELGVSSPASINPEPIEDDEEEDDPYAKYAELYDEDDDVEEDAGGHARRHA